MFVSMATFVSIGPTFVSVEHIAMDRASREYKLLLYPEIQDCLLQKLVFFLQPEYEKKQVEKEKDKLALEVSQLPEEDKRDIHQKSKLLKAIASKLIWPVCGR